MGKEILTSGDVEIEENKFYRNKTLSFWKNVDIEKVLASDKGSFGEKTICSLLVTCIMIIINYITCIKYYIILHILHFYYFYFYILKTRAYVKSCDGQTKWMYFLIEDHDLLEKYNTMWDKVSADIKKEFDSEPVYKKIFWKLK